MTINHAIEMNQKIIITTAISVLIVAELCRAETRTFTETVRVVLGSCETKGQARQYALLEAKRRVLRENPPAVRRPRLTELRNILKSGLAGNLGHPREKKIKLV